MSYFIIEQLFLLSIAVMVFLFVRNLPQVRDFDNDFKSLKYKKGSMVSVGHNLADKFDDKLSYLIEKTLRKLKVFIMRIDNYISSKLKVFSSKNNESLEDRDTIFNNFEKNEKNINSKKDIENIIDEKKEIIIDTKNDNDIKSE